LEQVERFRRSGDLASALRVSEAIWASPSETFQLRFAAAENMDRIIVQRSLQTQDFASRHAFMQRRLEVTGELLSVGEKENAPEHLRLYAGVMHCSANLSTLFDRYLGLTHSERVQQQGGTLVPIIRAGKQHTMVLFFREHERGHEFLADLLRKGYRHLVAPAWSLIVMEINAFGLILRVDGQFDASVRLVNWIDNTVRPIAEAAAHAKDWNSVSLCAVQQVGIGAGPNPVRPITDCVVKARELLGLISDERIRRQREQWVTQQAATLAEVTTASYHRA
jgi:hypothetical protein